MKYLHSITLFVLFGMTALLLNSYVDDIPAPFGQPQHEQEAETSEWKCIFEVPAQFPGSTLAWKEFLKKNLKRPKVCVEGKVFLSFVVEINGKISDIIVMRGIFPDADQYAVELLESSPKWIPGEQRGVPVKTRMMISIRFSLDSWI